MSERKAPNELEKGTKRYRDFIHADAKRLDQQGNLPFTFSKPKKSKPTNTAYKCEKCGHESCVTEDTILVICAFCKHITRLKTLDKKGLF